MRRAVALATGVGVAVGLTLLLFPRSRAPVDASREPTPPRPGLAPGGTELGPRRSVLEQARFERRSTSDRVETAPRAPEAPSSHALERRPEAPALAGLEVSAVGAGDRERLKVPNEYGTGVVITRVHPDAPAAESGLRPGDVIVRAMRENVNGTDDLTRVVGQRDHTVLIAVRDGRMMQLVVQKPYDGS